MSADLTLDEAYLSAAVLSLQAAINSLRDAECGVRFSFESVTGISETASSFFAELDQNLSQLALKVAKGSHTVTLLANEATIIDQQLARVGSAGFVLPA